MTHRLSNCCRVEKTNKIFLLVDSSNFLVYDRKTTSNLLHFFSIPFAPQGWVAFRTRTYHRLNEWHCEEERSAKWLSWEQMCHDSQMTFFFLQLVEVVTFLALWFEKTLLAITISHETNDAGFKMRHTYACDGGWLLTRLDTSLRIQKKQNHKERPTDFEEGDMFNLPSAFEANGIKCEMSHGTSQ